MTGQKRSPAAPEVPLVRETIAGFDGSSWQGIVAPAGTPKEIVRRLSAEIARLVRRPEFHDPYAANGVELVGSSPEQFATFVEGEIARWQLVASTAGMTPE